MPKTKPPTSIWPEGSPGSVPPRVLAAILKTRDFNDRRDRDLRALLGSYRSRDPVVDTIVTECLVNFARGKYLKIGEYQALLKPEASAFAVRHQILRLENAGVLIVRHDAANPRFTLIAPTARTCAWAILVAPRWVKDALRLFGGAQDAED